MSIKSQKVLAEVRKFKEAVDAYRAELFPGNPMTNVNTAQVKMATAMAEVMVAFLEELDSE